jgi:hypothetical protein
MASSLLHLLESEEFLALRLVLTELQPLTHSLGFPTQALIPGGGFHL